MPDIVGVRYKKAGRIYYFDPVGLEMAPGDKIIVETSRGLEMGTAVVAPTEVAAEEITEPLKPVVRLATEEDLEKIERLEERKQKALEECGKLIEELKLPMKLVDADVNLEESRLTVYFGAEGRVDFRELVRELSHRVKMRVEMRQIGPRDEAKFVGGYGRCGQGLCCQGFISEFNPVSIKMAKEQGLPLNPMKISGVCGRLLCCLGYEYEQYRDMKKEMPREGTAVATPRGKAIVTGVNIMDEKVNVELESGGVAASFPLSEISTDLKSLEAGKKEEKPESHRPPSHRSGRRRRRKEG
jgi:cell fate regulator YaaT (PSP1 superfamily)